MQAIAHRHRRAGCLVVAALALAGCSGDVGQQITTDVQMRNKVMGAIATRRDLALEMTERLMANDSLRTPVVDAMLKNGDAAQYVLFRIATNEKAMDFVLGTAARDSAMRRYVMTLVKGMQMASPK